ncbi:MAG: peroxiredoxin [Xanthomonadales bacterium]|nr:peroxiredoxin [Xanthomonadales bacterium]
MMKIGSNAPDLSINATGADSGEKTISIKDFKGQFLVLYFYPKDNTPGCTREGQDFRDLYPQFQSTNCAILGVSRDSVRVHENFRKKHEFPFDLLSDADEKLCHAFGVIREKKLYGRTYMGIVRSTFLIGPDGKLLEIWDKVKVKEHAQDVLSTLLNNHIS